MLTAIGRVFFPVRLAVIFIAGIRAFRKDSYERMDIRSTGMEFASEMVVKASLLRMKVCRGSNHVCRPMAAATRRTSEPGTMAGATCDFC